MISQLNFRRDVPIVKLQEVVEFLDNKRKPITGADRVSGPYPYYGANGVQDYVADWIFDEDLVLLAEDGGHFENPDRGVAYKITGKSWVNNHAHVLRAKENVDTDYLQFILMNMDLMPYISGSTRLKLNKSAAEKILIPLPPITEQQRIASILNKAHDIKIKREETIEKLDQLAKNIFADKFLNKGFPSYPLKDLCNLITDGTHYTPKDVGVGTPFLTVRDMSEDGLDFETCSFISGADFLTAQSGNCSPQLEDVLFSKDGTVGKVHVVTENVKFAVLSSVAILRPDKNKVLPHFLGYTLKSPQILSNALAKKTGAAIRRIILANLKDLLIPVPPIDVQLQFVTEIERLRQVEHNSKAQLDQINKLIKSLQNQAFSVGFSE